MSEMGFGERRFPDGRVLRLCSPEAGSTISGIGRELGITRQGATKVVTHLRESGYVRVVVTLSRWSAPGSGASSGTSSTSPNAFAHF